MMGRDVFKKMIRRELGFDDYQYIIEHFKNNNSEGFRKKFISYYDVREDKYWLDQFFQFFDSVKNQPDIGFETIVRTISGFEHKRKNRKEPVNTEETVYRCGAVYASKMLATINQEKPIIDSNVFANLNIEKIKGNTIDEKINDAIKKYKQVEEIHRQIKQNSQDMEKIKKLFKDELQIEGLSDSKMIDFLFWKLNKEELKEIEVIKKYLPQRENKICSKKNEN